MRLAILASHPIQYYAPLFRELAGRLDLHVFFAHRASAEDQGRAGYGTAFEWDVDLTSGYAHSFLVNVARGPGVDRFAGCDTPEIGERLAEGQFDVVLALGWHLKSLLQGIWAAKRLGLPAMVRGDSQIATPRGALKRIAKAGVYPILLRAFDAALYVGARSRAYYEHYHYPEDRLFFSPHCVDTEWFAARASPEAGLALRAGCAIPPRQKVVLFAGRLLPFKRPLDAVEACARLSSKGDTVRLMIAGAGELEPAVRARADALGATVTFLGFRNQSEMPAAYAAADLLVLPSDGRETWGLVCNEALACGTPIVVSAAAGCAPDLAADGVVGSTFSPGDIDALARALDTTLTVKPPIADIRGRARAYGVTAAADGVCGALVWLAGGRPGRSRTPDSPAEWRPVGAPASDEPANGRYR
jgi:glycosyltransferase involved in cell wall biosynthesis